VVGIRFALSGTNDASRPEFYDSGLGTVMLIGHYVVTRSKSPSRGN